MCSKCALRKDVGVSACVAVYLAYQGGTSRWDDSRLRPTECVTIYCFGAEVCLNTNSLQDCDMASLNVSVHLCALIPWCTNSISMTLKISHPTLQKTHRFLITKANQLMLYPYKTNILCGKNALYDCTQTVHQYSYRYTNIVIDTLSEG
jgi:hypothetical protein